MASSLPAGQETGLNRIGVSRCCIPGFRPIGKRREGGLRKYPRRPPFSGLKRRRFASINRPTCGTGNGFRMPVVQPARYAPFV